MATVARTYDSGATLYLLLRADDHTIWSTVTSTLVTYAAGDIANYDITMTEQGACGYYYSGTLPNPANGWYRFDWRVRLTSAPLESDPCIGLQSAYWDGTRWWGQALAATGADLIVKTSTFALAIADAVADEELTLHTTAATVGKTLADAATATNLASVKTDTGTTLPAAIQAANTILDKLNTTLEADGTNSKFTVAALAQAPSGTGSTPAQIWGYTTRTVTSLPDIDGLTADKVFTALLATAAGKVAITDNGDGTSTAVFKKQNGTNTALTVIYTSAGARTSTPVIP